jgi:hypothetical protein
MSLLDDTLHGLERIFFVHIDPMDLILVCVPYRISSKFSGWSRNFPGLHIVGRVSGERKLKQGMDTVFFHGGVKILQERFESFKKEGCE